MLNDEVVQSSAGSSCNEEEMKLRAIFASCPDAITVTDLSGNIIECNQPTLDMYGYSSKEELIGKSALELIAKKDHQRAMENLKKTLEHGLVRNIEYTFLTQDGREFPAELSASVIKDSSGNPIGFVAITKDIREREKVEEEIRESQERYRGLVELAPDSIVTLDMKGVVKSINTAALRLTGYSKEEFIGKHFSKIAPLRARNIPKYLKLFSSVVRGETPKPFETVYYCKDGTPRWVEAHVRSLEIGGKRIGIQAILRDVTERKQMENRLRRYSEHLEELVEERTEKLKEAERMAAIGETAAMVGHDLRNPLQVMSNQLYMGEKMLREIPPQCRGVAKGIKELFRIAAEQIEYMNKIISDLQNYARPLKPEHVETSLLELINETVSTITVPENVKVSLMIEESFPKLMVDRALMKRVFTNLITNALQAMPDGGQLTIRASRTEEAAFVSVQDNGVGIPDENLPKLFQPLFSTKPRGQGFGLPVCKRLVEAHNGSIMVKSKLGKGSTFTVKIPLRRR